MPNNQPAFLTTSGTPQPNQSTRLFRIYNHYRLAICMMLVGLLLVDPGDLGIQFRAPELFQIGVFAYLSLNVFIALLLFAGIKPQPRHVIVSISLDIAFLHGFVYCTSGIESGLANLVIIAVAAGNILTPSRIGTLYAALAAIGSLLLAAWSVLVLDDKADAIVRAGTLGILYFAAAFILQSITRRMTRSEALASSRAQSIQQLEQINQQIIQRMRTGILVVDRFGNIRLVNAAAEELLFGIPGGALAKRSPKGQALPRLLRQRLEDWLKAPELRTAPFQASPTAPLVQVNFTPLDQEHGELILVFVEDLGKVTQQAQQMKLAALGRLTAGIAHEIRNPLGAISHAAQLMEESDNLGPGDQKMLDIIHRHSKRVNGIIENVLDLSRRREASSELIDIKTWLPEFLDNYRHTARDDSSPTPNIQLGVDDNLPAARFDPSQIEQVMVNLCDNGLRYSFQTVGEATLQIHAGITSDGERAFIDIRDQGPGIQKENHGAVFEPFFTTDKSGTGLGLYLARELCEANQAHLSLLNDDQPGSCFRITFAHPGRLI
ncbi:sensor histidine kinase [Marinobacter zhejiangensis]|uniref:histidine kinase n=1 Tax=Marinobacter zhejiangensis TaxID=488535 RepID=A0A1I4S7S7_9GAMM|nr:ATP-binding protein [Marinobacter zhejiangensis]SFM60323.1 two-component system, NtrC family, sensor histidine kinase PilS [Marinobacter zhejiangensis]